MAYIGYAVYLDEGQPLAAAMTHDEAMSMTLARLAMLYAGDPMGLASTSISVQERDLSEEEVAIFERTVAEVTEKHRAGREALK